MTRWLVTTAFLLLTTTVACKGSEPAPEPPTSNVTADDPKADDGTPDEPSPAEPSADDAKTDDAKTDDPRWGLEEANDAPGGWTDRSPTDERVVEAAEVAVKELRSALDDPDLSLVSIRVAQTQVVAGVNFRVVLDVTGKAGPRTVAATIYRPLGKAAPKMTDHRVR